jgi:hypothetical protein
MHRSALTRSFFTKEGISLCITLKHVKSLLFMANWAGYELFCQAQLHVNNDPSRWERSSCPVMENGRQQ